LDEVAPFEVPRAISARPYATASTSSSTSAFSTSASAAAAAAAEPPEAVGHGCDESAAAAAADEDDDGSRQGLTHVHFSAQLKRFLWDRGCAKGLCSPC
jgi:hypothetical protein